MIDGREKWKCQFGFKLQNSPVFEKTSAVSIKRHDNKFNIVIQYSLKFKHYTRFSLSACSGLKHRLLGGLSCLLFGEMG